MKRITLLITITTIACTLSFGQSKKDLEIEVGKLKDELKTTSSALDSMTQSRDNFKVVYDELRAKVITFDFAPENFPAILDSFTTARQQKDSTFQSIMDGSKDLSTLNDSLTADLATLQAENDKLKIILNEFKVNMGMGEEVAETATEDVEETEEAIETVTGGLTSGDIKELKSLKELLDGGILSQEEFDARKKKILGN